MKGLGLDIGGANVKISDGWRAATRPFELWKYPQALPEVLGEMLAEFAADTPLAVTMTGELADCFETKSEGVNAILDAVAVVAGVRTVGVWQSGGEFVSIPDARELVPLVAAANWHALATWAGRMRPDGLSLLVDIGSTTTDVIPLEEGIPVPVGRTDLERLATGELVYLGVRRTPLCALANEIDVRERRTGIAREFFATTTDLHVILGHLPEEPTRKDTADGRPLTIPAARDRLARMLCADRTELSVDEIEEVCRALLECETELVAQAIRRVWHQAGDPTGSILLSGEGEFLGQLAIEKSGIHRSQVDVVSLRTAMSPETSHAACAFALARLAAERL